MKWLVSMFVVALAAVLFAFSSVMAGGTGLAELLVVLFLVLFVFFLLLAFLGVGRALKKRGIESVRAA